MKWILYTILGLSLVACSGKATTIRTGLEGKALPSFAMTLADSSTHMNSADIPKGKPFILLSFATWCPFCRAQTSEIVKHIDDFKDSHIYMLTEGSYQSLRDYKKHFQLDRYPEITVAMDDSSFFIKYFKLGGIPSFAMYGKDKKLHKVVTGKTPPKELKDLLLTQ